MIPLKLVVKQWQTFRDALEATVVSKQLVLETKLVLLQTIEDPEELTITKLNQNIGCVYGLNETTKSMDAVLNVMKSRL